MTALPVLYSFRRCPYAMRARMAVMQAGVTCELREVVLRNKPESMIELSPKGTVPVLLLPDGTVLDESLDVMHWALGMDDPDDWLDTMAQAAPLLEQLDGTFKAALDRYKYYVKHPQHPQSHYRDQGVVFLNDLEARLAANDGLGLFDRRLTFPDIAALPFVRQFAHVDKTWFDSAPFPMLQAWLDRNLESPLFLSVMTKHAPWQPGDDVITFGGGVSGTGSD